MNPNDPPANTTPPESAPVAEVVDPSYDEAMAEISSEVPGESAPVDAAPAETATPVEPVPATGVPAVDEAAEEALIDAQLTADPTNDYAAVPAADTPAEPVVVEEEAPLPTIDPAVDAKSKWQATPYSEEDEEHFVLSPSGAWPPPIYIDGGKAGREERFYMEHRWHAQWAYYDGKASTARKVYHRIQLIVGIGSVTVPVLISVGPSFGAELQTVVTMITIVISLCVTIATAIENVKQYGDTWRTMRMAAEELAREKALYDVKGGSYRGLKNPFLLFAERCEGIIDKQNGAWSALKEEQLSQAKQAAEEDDEG